MFGLMRAKKCGMSEDEKHFRRLNYCGTCKTIGSLYGQTARLLLDHDTVFLAELLTSLSGENVQTRQKSYQSFNCLNLPAGEMPLALQFAATANLILTEFKLADHISDEGQRRYQLARRTFAGDFEKAAELLRSWQFPLDEVKAILRTQEKRERETALQDADEILANLAAPTALTTGVFFRQGVRLVGKNELSDAAGKLGEAFGKLIYLVDAFEDFEKDFRAGQFNAVRAAFKLKKANMSKTAGRKIVSMVYDLETEIAARLRHLPIDDERKTLFVSRLKSNLHRKFRTMLPVAEKMRAARRKRTFADRWRNAKDTARALTGGLSWQMPLVFLFVFAFALAAPAQTKEARSARECFDLSFNLMFLGAIFGAVAAFPKTILTRYTRKGRPKQAADESSSDGCCDAWDCCCCACDGCGCDDCDCLSGCCDGCDCCSCDC